MTARAVWVNDHLTDASDTHVNAFDHGLTVGDGVFETLEVIGGVAFALGRHLGRLRRSAAGLGLVLPWSDDELGAAVAAVLGAEPDAGRLRITVTGGPSPLGSDRGSASPTLLVVAAPASPWATTSGVVVVPWVRNERSAVAGVKTTSSAENVVALARAHEAGADEAIFANTRGILCEGTGSNVFVVVDGRLCTPPLASGCLAGITRALVCELVEVEEVDLPVESLAAAEEAFLTSSTRRVQPIGSVDGVALPAAPGPLTAAAAAAFDALVSRDLDP
jgi:branched-chain amino acid aminotransferase